MKLQTFKAMYDHSNTILNTIIFTVLCVDVGFILFYCLW